MERVISRFAAGQCRGLTRTWHPPRRRRRATDRGQDRGGIGNPFRHQCSGAPRRLSTPNEFSFSAVTRAFSRLPRKDGGHQSGHKFAPDGTVARAKSAIHHAGMSRNLSALRGPCRYRSISAVSSGRLSSFTPVGCFYLDAFAPIPLGIFFSAPDLSAKPQG